MSFEDAEREKPLSNEQLLELAEHMVERARTAHTGRSGDFGLGDGYGPKIKALAAEVDEWRKAFDGALRNGESKATETLRNRLENIMKELDLTASALLGKKDWERLLP